MRIPLASFAADHHSERSAYCQIYVESLGNTYIQSTQAVNSIVIGSMFFQSISLYSRWN